MKTKLFLLGLVAALSFTTVQAQKTYVTDAFKTSKNVVVEKKQALQANLTRSVQLNSVLRAEVPDGMAMVTLTVGDVWGDGSGYQMLLDADATAYGAIFQETGPLTTGGDVSDAIYAEFEYKIPENADGALATSNIVMNNSISILIPAGTYDYCITNPTPGDKMWIASDNGNVGGRADDFVFQAGLNYMFSVAMDDQNYNDAVTLTIPVEGQALTTPESLTAVPTATTAAVEWVDNDDMGWTLRYRPYVDPATVSPLWDLPYPGYEEQLNGFYIYDVDGDGHNWGLAFSDDSQTDLCFYSASYENYESLTPDNWLITPAVGLGGTLKFKSWNHSSTFADMMEVYVCTNPDWESLDEFELLMDNIMPGTTPEEYEIDLSQFEGMGVIAFRHCNSEDMWTIYVDDINVIVPGAQELAEWVVVDGLDATNYTIEGLTPETEYEVQVQATGVNGTSAWTESCLFTTLPEGVQPGGKCAKPEGSFANGVDFHGVLVTLVNNETAEGTELHYNVTLNGEMIIEDAIYDDAFALTQDGDYYIDFWATAPGMEDSSHGGLLFTIDQFTGLSEVAEGKAVAGVRYYNVAGQEMAQPSGLTIMVTTYSDGSTVATKVVK